MKKLSNGKIIFLDAGTVDFGDLPLNSFSRYGHFKAYSYTRPDQIAARAKNAEVLITNKCFLDKALLLKLSSHLKAIHLTATGFNNIDLRAAKRLGIAVTNVAGYSTETVVQFTITFILALANNLVNYQKDISRGNWSRSSFFMMPSYPVTEVAGKTLCILGYGHIGRRVAQVAKELGMKILICKIPGRSYDTRSQTKRVSLEKGLSEADFFTIHTPLSSLTQSLIDLRLLRKMKPTAYMINMARGGIVDESALSIALNRGFIAGAATDVLTAEPPPKSHVLLKAKNLLMTPHMAWASLESRQRLVKEVVLNMEAFFKGRKRNRII